MYLSIIPMISAAWGLSLDPTAANNTFALSDVVIEGDIVDTMFRINDAGIPLTFYTVDVVQTLKGTTTSQIQMVLPGGYVDQDFIYVHGRPDVRHGDRIAVALTQMPNEEYGVGMMTTFSLAIAKREISLGGAPMATDGDGNLVRGFIGAQPIPMAQDAAYELATGECMVNYSEFGSPPALTWDEVIENFSAQIAAAESSDHFRVGELLLSEGNQ